MRKLAAFGLFLIPSFAFATSTVVEQENQLQVFNILEPAQDQVFYGELTNYPHTYEFVVPEQMELSAEISVPRNSEHKKSLIVIREEKRGVSEVGRVAYNKDAWESSFDWLLGRFFSSQGPLVAEIESGIYRIEVSSPDNLGTYKLVIGVSQQGGYISRLHDAWVGTRFFGWSFFSILRSPLVFSSLLFIGILYYVVRRFRSIQLHNG